MGLKLGVQAFDLRVLLSQRGVLLGYQGIQSLDLGQRRLERVGGLALGGRFLAA